MANVAVLVSQIQDTTDCSICKLAWTDPRTLPTCLHSFCLQCLTTHVELLGDKPVLCPICRQEFSVPVGGLGAFPKNFMTATLLDWRKVADAAAGESTGSIEDQQQQPAVVSHISRVYQNSTSKPYGSNCEHHTAERVNLYCNDCQKPLCTVCYATKHKEHACVEVQKAREGFVNKILKCSKRMDVAITLKEEEMPQLEKKKKEFIEKISEKEEKIKTKKEKLTERMETEHNQLRDELKEIKDLQIKQMKTRMDEVTVEILALKSTKDASSRLIANGLDYEICSTANDLVARGDALLKSQMEQRTTQPNLVDVTFSEAIIPDVINGCAIRVIGTIECSEVLDVGVRTKSDNNKKPITVNRMLDKLEMQRSKLVTKLEATEKELNDARLKERLKELNDARVEELNDARVKEINEARLEIEKLQKQNDARVKEINEARQKEINEARLQIEKLQKQNDAKVKEINEARLEIEKLQKQNDARVKEINEARQERNEARLEIQKLKKQPSFAIITVFAVIVTILAIGFCRNKDLLDELERSESELKAERRESENNQLEMLSKLEAAENELRIKKNENEAAKLEMLKWHRQNVINNTLYIVGLNDGKTRTSDVYQISLQEPEIISKMKEIPTVVVPEAQSCAIGNFVYVTGACGPVRPYSEVWRLDLLSEDWFRCADMITGRRRHCAVMVDLELYVLGGLIDDTGTVIASVESYNIVTNSWFPAGNLICAVESAACVTYGSVIYVFGGSDSMKNEVAHVQVYDPVTQHCSLLDTPMPYPTNLLRAVLWETSVILMDRDTCLIYNFEMKTWLERKQFKTDVIHFGLVLDNQTLYIAGGGTSVSDKDSTIWTCTDKIKSVSVLDVIEDKPAVWKHHAKLPKPAMIHAYITAVLP